MCEKNFHGRTITVIGCSEDPKRNTNFGPFTPGFEMIPYDDINALEEICSKNKNIWALLIEPIQAEAGVILPSEGYFKKVR